jgi:hypothetical protein
MSVQARRGDEVGEPIEQLKRCESELGAPVRCRTWESIDEAESLEARDRIPAGA